MQVIRQVDGQQVTSSNEAQQRIEISIAHPSIETTTWKVRAQECGTYSSASWPSYLDLVGLAEKLHGWADASTGCRPCKDPFVCQHVGDEAGRGGRDGGRVGQAG